MKAFCLTLSLTTVTACSSFADKTTPAEPARYSSEAKLPEGWPAPGPFDQVTEKSYPAYRAAFAENGSFWTLFRHIKRNSIPMTSPVEMDMTGEESLKEGSMAFLYQNTTVGSLGADGKNVNVQDVPAQNALSYSWMGPRTKENIAKAKASLDAELKKRGITAAPDYRLLGYNSPSIPKERRTFELQVLLP